MTIVLLCVIFGCPTAWTSEITNLNGHQRTDRQRDSLNIRFVGQCSTPGYACQVCVQGPYAYVADYGCGLRIIDISDPAAPVEIGSCDSVYDAMHVVVHGTYAYVASSAHGMHSVDVSDPRNPVVAGVFPALSTQGILNVDIEETVYTAYAIESQS